MSSQPPLNPDALTRRDIMAGQIGAWIDEWDDGKADTAHVATHVANMLAENGITTLAVAQPVVNSVEELDALPLTSVIRTDKGWVYERRGLGWMVPGLSDFADLSTNTLFPARVIWSPEVNE